MRAAVIAERGLEIREVPKPAPKPNELLVKVRASGLNRADLMMTAGLRHGALGGAGQVAGLEWAGEVAEAGADVKGVKPGDRVMCSGAGGYAEYAVCDWGRAMPVSANNMSYEQAATLPIALQTMHDALITNGRMRAGEAVLIQGASSGVGLMALQIAKLKGARLVIGTSTHAGRRARLKEFGADLAIDSSQPDWADDVLKATDGKGVDLIVDQVSASVANQNLKAIAILGRIVNVGRLGGFKGEFDFDLHALRRITYVGVTFRTRSVEEVRAITAAMRADIWGAVESGRLVLPIDRTFPLAEAAAAQAHMRANQHFGKIVLTV
ncbi:MAG: zinc-binding dehydrogenase [Alphaproteobacteria bacterium]|nr:zinc-binding dehydrogenase [Alphaproteobacteria bacterium]